VIIYLKHLQKQEFSLKAKRILDKLVKFKVRETFCFFQIYLKHLLKTDIINYVLNYIIITIRNVCSYFQCEQHNECHEKCTYN